MDNPFINIRNGINGIASPVVKHQKPDFTIIFKEDLQMIRNIISMPNDSGEYSFICKRFCDLRFMKGCVILCTLSGRMR